MSGQYTLRNYNANRTTDVGSQQISIRPYDEVTSLNVNQLLNDVVGMGPLSMGVTFESPSAGELVARIASGFGGFFKDHIEHEVAADTFQDRTYVVRVGFETSATTSISLQVYGTVSVATVFRTGDKENAVGQPSNENRRLFLAVRYSWEEGMLGAATTAGSGTGAGNVGPFASLVFEQNPPRTLAQTNPQLFSKTIYLGEVLNLSEGLSNDGGGNVVVQDVGRIGFRSFASTYETLQVFENLRKANRNLRLTYNPTGDYVYVNSGKTWLGSAYISIPEGLQHRERIITPLANLSTDPLVQPNIEATEVSFDPTTGQPVDSGGDPIPAASTTIGQYDVLVLSSEGNIRWVVHPLTTASDGEYYQARQFAQTKSVELAHNPSPQTPGHDAADTSMDISSTLSRLYTPLSKPFVVLCVLRRLYYNDGGFKKLRPNVWNADGSEWLLYEHNPMTPALAVPDVTDTFAVAGTLIIPVEEV